MYVCELARARNTLNDVEVERENERKARMAFVAVAENTYNEKHGGDIYVGSVITDLNNPRVTEAVGSA